MINFDKIEIKKALTIDDIYSLLLEWGGEPEYTQLGLISKTICHNEVGNGSPKLYYYESNQLFYCYTNCGSFDIFDLVIKVKNIQDNKVYDLNDAVRWIAYKFGIIEYIDELPEEEELEDWKIFERYSQIEAIEKKDYSVNLQNYDDSILSKFNYNVRITPWIKEGISAEILSDSHIGFYPGGDQITIPHYDINNRFIGLRGRALSQEDAEYYGKYRPLKINKILYTHPLGMNLYNLNNSKNNIARMEKAIVFEGEKSVLKYRSYFGEENDISVACCGSNLSIYQIEMLRKLGAKEIIIAFDRQFKELGDDEYKKLVKKLKTIHTKYKNFVKISFVFDKKLITDYKASPIDAGPEIFLQLFKERVIL